MTSDAESGREAQEADELMRRVADGDQLAFGQIVERYRSHVVTACRNAGAAADEEDMAHIALLKAWDRAHTYRGGGKLRPWLGAIARNTTRDELRKRKRRPAWSLDSMAESTDTSAGRELPSFEISTEDQALSATYRQAIEEAFALLNDNQRRVMTLLIFEEMHYEEIADVTGLKVGTVKSNISRAREKMISYLREQGIQWPPRR